MKKLLIFVLLSLFVAACSQYTCPTYSKNEGPAKKSTAVRKI
jgi:PBP1b-binding outer membrane lipoprotein LpoB